MAFRIRSFLKENPTTEKLKPVNQKMIGKQKGKREMYYLKGRGLQLSGKKKKK